MLYLVQLSLVLTSISLEMTRVPGFLARHGWEIKCNPLNHRGRIPGVCRPIVVNISFPPDDVLMVEL